jgi:GTP-binding protein
MSSFKNYQFWGSVYKVQDLPKDGLPEIIFVGRSNVGKSSLINKLLGSQKAAQVSKQPGKTKALNFFKIDNKLYMVDFPGYGYAKVSKSQRQSWKRMIDNYLTGRENIKLAVLIVDARHKSFTSDIEMKNWFDSYNIPVVIIATKTDKVTRAHLHSIWIENIKDFNSADGKMPLFFSAVTGQGRNELIKEIEARIK